MKFTPTICQRCMTRGLDGIEWSETSRTISYRGNCVRLKPAEFTVFDMLMKRFGQVVRRDHMFAELWGNKPSGGPLCSNNLISIYVSRVRRALHSMEVPLEIDSTWGVGYFIHAHNNHSQENASPSEVMA